MRLSFLTAALLSLLATACTSAPQVPPVRVAPPPAVLKVHPGLLGQPASPEAGTQSPTPAPERR